MKKASPSNYPPDWPEIAKRVKASAGWKCVRCGHAHTRENWRILTVHHWDGNKANCQWWNLMALCQRCHLSIQGRVDPKRPYFLEHSDWCKPYAAGFYAFKYLGLQLTRKETMARLDELLALERRA